MTEYATVESEVVVKATPERAFALFTANIGDWWAVDSNSVYRGTVSFEGDELIERSGAEVAVWAEVTRWEPAVALGLTWHAGQDATRTTDVLVTFTPQGDQTLVHLTHTAWERLLDGEQASREYAQGWPPALEQYAGLFA